MRSLSDWGWAKWTFPRFMTPPLAGGANTAKITVNVWDFGPLGTAVTSLQRGGFLTFATNLNSFIEIIHSAENKSIKEGATSINSNCKSSHVASNFVVICIMFIRRVCIKPPILTYIEMKR